ncbi:unnamed protein product, partial [Ranitomeya imitator]
MNCCLLWSPPDLNGTAAERSSIHCGAVEQLKKEGSSISPDQTISMNPVAHYSAVGLGGLPPRPGLAPPGMIPPLMGPMGAHQMGQMTPMIPPLMSGMMMTTHVAPGTLPAGMQPGVPGVNSMDPTLAPPTISPAPHPVISAPPSITTNSTSNDEPAKPQMLSKCPWKEFKSDSGKPYYYNSQTKESRWSKPKDLEDLEAMIKAEESGSVQDPASSAAVPSVQTAQAPEVVNTIMPVSIIAEPDIVMSTPTTPAIEIENMVHDSVEELAYSVSSSIQEKDHEVGSSGFIEEFSKQEVLP